MSDLPFTEKRRLEKQLGMGGGYVLDFSNRTLTEFVADSTGRNIYDARYDNASGSKANRLRAFWSREPNHLVGKLITDLLKSGDTIPIFPEAVWGMSRACLEHLLTGEWGKHG